MSVETYYGIVMNLSELIKYFEFLGDYNFRYDDNFNRDDNMFNGMLDDFMNYHVNLEKDISLIALTYNFNRKYMNDSELKIHYINDDKYYEPNIFHNRLFIIGYNLTYNNNSTLHYDMFYHDIDNVYTHISIHDILRDTEKKIDYYHIRYD